MSVRSILSCVLQNVRKIIDDKGFVGGVLLDLPKAYETLHLEPLITKFSVYGFNNESLKLMQPYLTIRWQRAKLNKGHS